MSLSADQNLQEIFKKPWGVYESANHNICCCDILSAMSKLVYPTSRVVRGPLLLSKQQLSRLDEIVERQLPHIEGLQEQIWKRELAKDLERTARYRKEKFTEADLEERRQGF